MDEKTSRVSRAILRAVSIPFLLVLIPPMATIPLNSLVESDRWGLYGVLVSIVSAWFVLSTVLVRVSMTARDHPGRERLHRDLLPQIWSFVFFLPLVFPDPNPTQPWPGVGLAVAGLILIVANRRVLNPAWDPAWATSLFCAGIGVMAQVVVSNSSFVIESALLYAAYGLGAALIIGSWDSLLR